MYAAIADVKSGFQKLLDFSLDVICTIDAQLRFETVSAAAGKLWGYEPRELVGRTVMSLVVEEQRAETERILAGVRAGCEKACFEIDIYRKDGSVATVSWSACCDHLEHRTYCVARTVEKKKVEGWFVETEEQLRFAQKMARIGSWHIDAANFESRWSEGLYHIFGLSQQDYPIPSVELFFSLVHPDEQKACRLELQKLIDSGKTDYVHRMIRPDGKTIYVRHLSETLKDEQGNVVAVTGVAQDITEQKEAEIKLELSEQKFKSLVQNGSDIIVVLDQQGIFKYASPTTLRIAGYDPEELVGRNAMDLIHPDDVPEVQHKLSEVLSCCNDSNPVAHRFLAKNGQWIWLESHGSNLIEASGIFGIVINSRNITERKKLEEQLQLEQKDRQRDITSAVIKAQESERSQLGQELHDNVNQVLTTVKLYNEMLLDGLGDREDILHKSVHHLQSCINEIRSISKRLSAPTLGKISLQDSIHELVDSINLTKRLHISFSITGLDNITIPQDFHLTIYRIIQEQINNIIKYADAREVFITIENSPKEFLLQIRDDGKGFDTKAKRSGIGITNMETRTENLLGRLEVESAPSKGCCISARFPPLA